MSSVYGQILDAQAQTLRDAQGMAQIDAQEYPEAQPSVYGQILDAQQAALKQASEHTLARVMGQNADRAARAQQLAKTTGLAPDVVQRNFDALDTRDTARRLQAAVSISPVLRRQLTDPAFTELAHDDLDTLTRIESIVGAGARYVMGADNKHTLGGDLGAFWHNANTGAAGAFRAVLETPAPLLDWAWGRQGNPLRVGADWFGRAGAYSARRAQELAPPRQSMLGRGIFAGAQSILHNVPLLGMSVATGNPVVALTGMSTMAGGGAYHEGREQGLAPIQALPYGMSQGAIEFATEKIPASRLLGDVLKHSGLWKTLNRQWLPEIAGEQAATILQDLNDWAVLPENRNKPISDYLRERPSAAAETLIATIVGVGGQTALLRGVDRAVTTEAQRQQRAQAAQQQADFLENLAALVQADKLAQRDPETFEQFIEAAAQDGPVSHVYIEADALMQSGLADQLAQVSPAIAEQLPAAVQLGGQIAIPIAEYAARIAPTQHASALMDHLKTDPEGFTRQQAQAVLQDADAELAVAQAHAFTEAQMDEAFKASAQTVRDALKAQLDAADRFTPQVNDAYAAMVSNAYAVQAARLGMTPEALFEQYPVSVVAQPVVQGQQLAQSLAAQPPTGWKHATDGQDAAAMWDGTEKAESVFWTELQGKLAQDAPELAEYSHSIGQSAIAHIKGKHGDPKTETPRGQIAITGADIALIPEIVTSYDALRTDLRSHQGAPVMVYAKRVDDGVLVYLEEVTRKRQNMRGVSLRKYSPTANVQNLLDKAVSPGPYAQDVVQTFPHSGNHDSTGRQHYDQDAVRDLVMTHNLSEAGQTVATLTGEEIAPRDVNLKTLRAAAKQWYETNLRGKKVVNQASGREIEFRNARKAFSSSANPDKLRLFAALEQIVAEGEIKNSRPPENPAIEGNTKAYHWLEAAVSLDGKPVTVGVTIREDLNGNMYYNHNPIEKAPLPTRSAPPHKGGGGIDASALNQTIPESADGVNLEIVNQGESAPRGQFSPSTHTIALLKNADLSTFLHESGHFFLEMQADLASRADAPQAIRADMQTVLDWFGVADLQQWQALPFEEKRAYHEQYARGFEAYLFEGKSPSVEMQGLFQRFRAWLLHVYRDLKALNVELNDQVRGVFDRLLATNEQIALAEQAQSMLPLFESAEQAGLTPEEFAQYQALGVAATQQATEELQAKGARDMLWTRNIHARVLKDLQKQAASRRRELRIQARREVMQQPIYRAWQFLTGKITADDTIPPPAKPASDPNTLDPAQDDLFTAIAKLGGVQAAQVQSQWGFDAKLDAPVFGKPVVRKTGGLTLDALGEELAQYGYLAVGENGRFDARELEDKFHAQAAGQRQFSSQYDYSAEQDMRAGDQIAHPQALGAARLAVDELRDMALTGSLPATVPDTLKRRRMTAKNGLHPDLAAELLGFGSGDELVRKLADAPPPFDVIEAQVAQRMLEEHGELSSPDALARAADAAVHNAVRARFVAAEMQALQKATGQPRVLNAAARQLAQALVARQRVRDIRPGQYTRAAARAAQKAQEAMKQAGKVPVKGVALSASGLPQADSISAMQLRVREQVKQQFVRPEPYTTADGAQILVTWQNVKHAATGQNTDGLAVMLHLDKVIEAARLIKSEPDRKGRRNIVAAHQYASKVMLDGTSAEVILYVREHLDGKRYYDHALVKENAKKNPDGIPGEGSQANQSHQPAPGFGVHSTKAAQALSIAASEKRNQLVQHHAARAAHDALAEVEKGIRYLKKFDSDTSRKRIDPDYHDQIDKLLERVDLRTSQSGRAIDKRTSLANWIESQRESGMEPVIPEWLENEASRTHYKNLTLEQFRGLVDTVRQIEHLGRLKNRLLTEQKKRTFAQVVDELVAGISEHANGKRHVNVEAITRGQQARASFARFFASHIKASSWARVMDGGKDGGPMWQTFIRTANAAGDKESRLRAQATHALTGLLAPVLARGKLNDTARFVPEVDQSFNRQQRFVMALNMGNAGNLQRLLDGQGWTAQQLQAVVQDLTAADWQAVQGIWDYFETLRPEIAAKERRVSGVEPQWITPQAFSVTSADGAQVDMRGGYYPIKYDLNASHKAFEHDEAESARRQIAGAYTSATTRRSFTRTRADAVKGRKLSYSLGGLYTAVDEIIHDLSWHEWLIDTNRLLRNPALSDAIRTHYGALAHEQLTRWASDIAAGDLVARHEAERFVGVLRRGVSAAGLGMNVMSAAKQILGLNQTVVRIGAKWTGAGLMAWLHNPRQATRSAREQSVFMQNRFRTRLRELAEVRDRVQGKPGALAWIQQHAYWLMMQVQTVVDVMTWHGMQARALSEGKDADTAAALADQAVLDSQGGGQTKDLSGIERGGPIVKALTVFYSFMNTAANLSYVSVRTQKQKARLAADLLMLLTVPTILESVLVAALTPGDSGDWDDWESIASTLIEAQLSYLMGLFVGVRELQGVSRTVSGKLDMGYSGPAGFRVIADMGQVATQAMQGELDAAFVRSAVNLLGDASGLPAAQVNRMIKGSKALLDGDTDNPLAVIFGHQSPR